MNRLIKINVLLLCVCLFAPAGYANSYSELSQLVKDKKYEEAFKFADKISKEESGNVEFDMLYGLAARESKHPDIAVFAFERVLARDKKNARAHYEMGLTLFNISDLKGATVALRNALKGKASANVRANSQKLLETVEKQLQRQSRPKPSLASTVKIGYNSNVNGSSTEINLEPPKGPVMGDGFAEAMLSGKFQKRFSKNDGFFLVLTDVFRKNFSSTNFDYNVTTAELGYNLQINNIKLTFPYGLKINIAKYQPVLFSNSLGFSSEFGLSETQSLTAEFNIVANHRREAINDQISAQISAKHKGAFLKKQILLGSEIFYNPVISGGSAGVTGSSVRDEFGGATQVTYEFIKAHAATLKAKYENLRYKLIPNNQTNPRVEHTISTQVSYSFDINSNWSLGSAYIFVYRLSTDPEKTNARHEAYANVSAKF